MCSDGVYYGWRLTRELTYSAIYTRNSGLFNLPRTFKIVQYKKRVFLIMITDIRNVTPHEYNRAADIAKRFKSSHIRPHFYTLDIPC